MIETDIVIVGAGTAGLSAAIYVQRSGKKATVLEALTYGGQIITTPEVENYPGIKHISGFDFAMGLVEQAQELGAQIEFDGVKEIVEGAPRENGRKTWIVRTGAAEYHAGAVIIASGLTRKTLGLPNEEALSGRGVSYCATCDGAFYRGKETAVVGGAAMAAEDAMYLANVCSKVWLVVPGSRIYASPSQIAEIEGKENIEVLYGCDVQSLDAGEDGRLYGITVADKASQETRQIPVAGVFVAIGRIPANQPFANVVELDKAGYIVADEDTRTASEGIYVAGDCRTKRVRQLTTAAADGAVAALAACAYVG